MGLSTEILVKATLRSCSGRWCHVGRWLSSAGNAPYWCNPSPDENTGLNSPTSEAGATPLTAGSKPAHICHPSSLRRCCCWQILLCPSLSTWRRSLFPCTGTSLSKSTEAGQDLWLVFNFPKLQHRGHITPEITLWSAGTQSHSMSLVSAQTTSAGTSQGFTCSSCSLRQVFPAWCLWSVQRSKPANAVWI